MVLGAARSLLPTLLALLGALLSEPGGAETSVYPQQAIIPRGGSMQVNCSATCDQDAHLGLETQLAKKEVASGNNWKTYELSNIKEDSAPICFSNCNNNQTAASATLTVYWIPELVELAPLPTWQPVGETLTLSCRVKGGAPRARLSVVLLRGEEELRRQLAVGEPAEVTATVLAGREDHEANFSCRTELDLRPQGLELFQNSSVSRRLRTFVLPMIHPHLAAPPIIEVGTQWQVECTMDGLFPASEAEVDLMLEDQRLKSTLEYDDSKIWARASVKADAENEGTQQLMCVVKLGNQSRSTEANVTIYSFPAPNLTLSQSEVSEWTVVSVECKAHAKAIVTLSGASDRSPGPSAQFLLNASAEDNERSFMCSAAIEVAGMVLHKNKTQSLHVLYGPRLEEEDCPGNWTWQEGSQQILKCQARGNPTPNVTCRQKGNGNSLPIGVQILVKREISGTYVCQATSLRGEVTHEVAVIVILNHENHMVIIIVVAVVLILVTVGTAAYLYNRQRKIREYKLQKAQEAAAMKLNTPP